MPNPVAALHPLAASDAGAPAREFDWLDKIQHARKSRAVLFCIHGLFS
jgi:hypothetical protein